MALLVWSPYTNYTPGKGDFVICLELKLAPKDHNSVDHVCKRGAW